MGLDTIEVVMWAEDVFDIVISDADASKIITVGDFSAFIVMKVNSSKNKSLTNNEVLPKLIDMLVKDYGIKRDNIKTSSRFVKDLGLD